MTSGRQPPSHAASPGTWRRRAALRGLAGLGAAVGVGSACTPLVRQTGDTSSTQDRSGGHLIIAQGADINLETFRPNNTPNLTWHRLVFNTLTEYDHQTLEPQPSLATSWDITDRGRVVTLQLRDDAVFHSGRPLEPIDVIETLRFEADPADGPGQLHTTAAAVEDLEQSGPHEVRLRLAHNVTNLFDLFEIMYIVDHETIDEVHEGTFSGTGPFMMTGRSPGQSVEFTRQPHYWKPDRPYLDSIELRVMAEQQAILAALESGQVHVGFEVTGHNVQGLEADDRFTLTETITRNAVYYIGCNVEVPPLDDKRVRQAIAHAVDRDKALNMGVAGYGVKNCLPWPPTSPAYDEELARYYSYDPDRARQLLEEAGAAGARLELAIPAGDAGPSSLIAEIVHDGLQRAGLEAFINPMQGTEFTSRLTTATLPGLFVAGHGFGHLHPATLLKGAFPFNAEQNASNFVSEEYAELAERAWTAETEEAEQEAYAETTAFLLDEQFVIDLVSSSYMYLSTSSLRDYSYTMFDNLILDDAYMA